MGRLATPVGMAAGKVAQVVCRSCDAGPLTQRASDWSATLAGQGFARTLLCCMAAERRCNVQRFTSCLPSRKAAVMAMRCFFGASRMSDSEVSVTLVFMAGHDLVIELFAGRAYNRLADKSRVMIRVSIMEEAWPV